MKHATSLILCLPFVLAGCVVAVPAPVQSDQCGASDLQYLVGQRGRVLQGMRFSQDLRVIQPGTAVTMDYRADRLNIRISDRDVIVEVACG